VTVREMGRQDHGDRKPVFLQSPWTNFTPSTLNRSNSACTSSTANQMYGIPSATVPFLNSFSRVVVRLENQLDAVGILRRQTVSHLTRRPASRSSSTIT
jgi:hypothetical protein